MAIPGIVLTNEKEFQAALLSLPVELRKRGLTDALRRAGRVVVKRAQMLVPVSTGTLKKSLGLIIRRPRRSKGNPYVVIGARRGFSRMVSRLGYGGMFSYTQKATPANYAHLVELGYHVAVGGTLDNRESGKRTRVANRSARTGQGTATQFILARPFLRPAFASSGQAVLTSLVESLRSFQIREAARLARRLTKRGK